MFRGEFLRLCRTNVLGAKRQRGETSAKQLATWKYNGRRRFRELSRIRCVGDVFQRDDRSIRCWCSCIVDHLVQYRCRGGGVVCLRPFLAAGHSLITRQKDDKRYRQQRQRDYCPLWCGHHEVLCLTEVGHCKTQREQ